MKRLIFLGWFLPILFLTVHSCKKGTGQNTEAQTSALTLSQALQNVDSAAYIIMAAHMADSTFDSLPLGFRIGTTHAAFMAHADSLAENGEGRIEDGKLIYYTNHDELPSDITVNNTSLINIGTVIPDTLPVSSVEYVYNLPQTDSIQVIQLIEKLMGGARKGGFKASPVLPLPHGFVQVWTRMNLIFRVYYIKESSSLHFCATNAKILSDMEILGQVASIKAGVAQCYISLDDIKGHVQHYCRNNYSNYKGEGRWYVDWYTSSIVVRHRYSFTGKRGKRIMRESMFHFDYALILEKEFTLSETELTQ